MRRAFSRSRNSSRMTSCARRFLAQPVDLLEGLFELVGRVGEERRDLVRVEATELGSELGLAQIEWRHLHRDLLRGLRASPRRSVKASTVPGGRSASPAPDCTEVPGKHARMPPIRHSGADGFLAPARQPCRCADARRLVWRTPSTSKSPCKMAPLIPPFGDSRRDHRRSIHTPRARPRAGRIDRGHRLGRLRRRALHLRRRVHHLPDGGEPGLRPRLRLQPGRVAPGQHRGALRHAAGRARMAGRTGPHPGHLRRRLVRLDVRDRPDAAGARRRRRRPERGRARPARRRRGRSALRGQPAAVRHVRRRDAVPARARDRRVPGRAPRTPGARRRPRRARRRHAGPTACWSSPRCWPPWPFAAAAGRGARASWPPAYCCRSSPWRGTPTARRCRRPCRPSSRSGTAACGARSAAASSTGCACSCGTPRARTSVSRR